MELVEREPHRAALGEYLAEARAGRGRLVLVSGEAGAGKTALLEVVERDLAASPWAWGACDALSTPRPLGPLLDLAPRLDAGLDGLCRGSPSRDQIFDAVLRALERAEPPVAVVFEDVHWADDATLDLLRFLGRRIRDLPALVAVTYRDDELALSGGLRDLLGLLAGQRSTRRVEVPPLSERGVARLAAGTAVEGAPLHRLTGGNPFFVTEILRTDHPAGRHLPSSVRDVVLGRAGRLGERAREALDVAALIGPRVRPSLLDAVTGAPARDVDAMLVCGIVRAEGDAFAFRHELARLAVEEAVPPHRAKAAHAAILAALLREGDSDDARLAFHAEAAGDAAAFRHALRAAREAARLGSHREAFAQYERAARHVDGLEAREHGSLLDALATEAAHVDEGSRAIEARRAAIALWEDLGDTLRAGDSLSELVSVLQRTARGAEATETAERAVAVLEIHGETDELARAVGNLARHRMMNGHHESALALAERAILMARRRSLPDVLSDAVNTRGCLRVAGGSDGIPDLEEAVRIAHEHGLGPQAGRGYSNLHAMLVGDLRLEEAGRVYAEGSEYCDRRDLAYWGWSLRRERFGALERTGRWDEALVLGEEVTGARLSVWNRIRAWEIAAVLHARRDEPGGWELLDQTREAVVGIGEPQLLAPNAVARAELHWLDGDLGAAAAELAGAEPFAHRLAPGEAGPLAVWTRRLRGIEVMVVAPPASPYRAELDGRLEDAVEQWDGLGCPYDAALVLAFSEDEAHLRDALGRLDRLGAPAAVRAVRRRMRELGLQSVPVGSRAATRANPAGLTRREQEVLELLCVGLTNERIAERLVLSTRTVDHHVSAVLRKLAVPSRQLAVQTARRSGLVAAGPEA